MNADGQAEFDRTWRHFQLHAEQRIAVFNFFVASSGLILSGLAYVLAGAPRLWPFGIAAGTLVTLLAFLFWKLDQRSSQLIRVAEAEIEALERASSKAGGVFTSVASLPIATSAMQMRKVWTFGRSFRLLFIAVGALGLGGAAFSLRAGFSVEPGSTARLAVERDAEAAGVAKVPDARSTATRARQAPTSRCNRMAPPQEDVTPQPETAPRTLSRVFE